MQDEKRREVALHFRVLCKWLDVTQNQESLLEEWSTVFYEIKSEYQRMDYLLSTLTLELSPMRILKEDDMAFFVRYHMITILKDRYSDRKKFERVPILESTYLLSLQPLLGQERKEFSFPNDYGKHFPETFVDRANYKLTFTLKDFVLSLKNVSGGNFIWKWTREEEECWFYLTNATLYIDDCNKFQSLTIYQEGLTALELDVRNFVTEGKLELDGLLERGKPILVRAKCDIRVIFPSGGKERNSLLIKSCSSCKFDLDPCLLEYSSREWFPFPYRFHIPDVDHLLNMERMVSGRPMKPMSPNSAEKYSRGGGIHDDMERLKTLRRMKVYQSLQQFVPYFSVGGESLCVIKENDHLVLYEKNFSLAKCFIKPEKSLILFDLIEFSSSTLIDSERIFRYPPLIY